MPTIGAEVDVQTKEKFVELARGRKLTPSRLAASLIADFIKREQTPPGAPPPAPVQPATEPSRGGARTEQVFVRLDPFYYAELGRLGDERSWKRSTYLANLFIAHADRRPVLCQAEIDALRPIARYLADMGRNINQVARKLNTSLDNAHMAMTIDLDLVRTLLDLEKTAVMKLVKANVKGWGMTDDEA